MGSSSAVGAAVRTVGTPLGLSGGQAAAGSWIPSCSAAIFAPCTRLAIFWNATSRV